MKKNIIIAIDGPAGAGKSTLAKRLAAVLGISYLDTGAMYRALTLKAMRKNVDLKDESALVALAKGTKIHLTSSSGRPQVFLDGKDVSEDIRSLEVTNNTFYIARAAKIREIMVDWQREIGAEQSIVVEGRDIGTVVFPQASFKFYLDAKVEERAHRRVRELREKGQTIDEKKLLTEVKERDQKDFTRDVGPLKKADGAIVIDSTYMSVDVMVEKVLERLPKEILARRK